MYQCVKKKVKEEIKDFWKQTRIKDKSYQNICNTAKSVLRGKFINSASINQVAAKEPNKYPNDRA